MPTPAQLQKNQANQSNRQKDFIAEIKTQGLSRTNRFTVEVTPPSATPATTRRILLLCEQASLPGISYASTQNRSWGETREAVYDRLFEPITLQFHVDRHFVVKQVFDDWMMMIQNPVTRSFNYYNNYTTKMKINIQDLQDETMYEVELAEAFPKAIVPISLDAESKDTMRLQVTFQYRYWTASMIQQNANGQKLTASGLNKYINDFSGFQEKYLKGLGEAGNFVTGAVGQMAMRSFSSVTSRIPSIKF
jgi:hypothetical protein